jgi:hypothetical protein
MTQPDDYSIESTRDEADRLLAELDRRPTSLGTGSGFSSQVSSTPEKSSPQMGQSSVPMSWLVLRQIGGSQILRQRQLHHPSEMCRAMYKIPNSSRHRPRQRKPGDQHLSISLVEFLIPPTQTVALFPRRIQLGKPSPAVLMSTIGPAETRVAIKPMVTK